MPRTNFKVGIIKASDIDLENIAFAVDTAGSWDGHFPDPDKGDYLVEIGSVDGGTEEVLVSRRYVSANDEGDAASLALSAFAERIGFETDDEGNILKIDHQLSDEPVVPCWVEAVYSVESRTTGGFKEITASLPIGRKRGELAIEFNVDIDVDSLDAVDVYTDRNNYDDLPKKLKTMKWNQGKNPLFIHVDSPQAAWAWLEKHALYDEAEIPGNEE